MTSSSFDTILDRSEASGTYSTKWQGFEERFPGYDVSGALPMWVADMDFLCPEEVVRAVVERAQKGIYGYVSPEAVTAFLRAGSEWLGRRHGYEPAVDRMLFTPGVLPALNAAIQEFTKPGDGIIIPMPVYYPFADGVKNNGRVIKASPLAITDGRYTFDFAQIERLAAERDTAMMIISSPHNPGGRVWSRQELLTLAEICLRHEVLLFSDEIHCDLILEGSAHTPIAAVGGEYERILIAAYAPSKTFNLAGLGASAIAVPDAGNCVRLAKRIAANRLPKANVFGLAAGEAAYRYGDRYADELTRYLGENTDYFIAYLEEHIPGVRVMRPEATYLVWADFRGAELNGTGINSFVLEKAKIAADLGEWFGEEGAGFVRFNLACPRTTVEQACERLSDAYRRLR